MDYSEEEHAVESSTSQHTTTSSTENELFQKITDIVQVKPYHTHNFKEFFAQVLCKDDDITEDDCFVLDNFGTALASADRLQEALCCYEEILKLQPNFLKSYQNLDNVKHQLVERWHFRMLNDDRRNSAFRQAISAVGRGQRVLDIGTGTGLLSLYAQQCGAAVVVACDDSRVMCSVAEQVLQRNEFSEKIRLVNQYSHDITAADLGGRVDLVITETLDSGVFGEGILQTLIHAKEELLKPDTGRVIPNRVKLYIAGFECKTIANENVCLNTSFEDLIYLKGHRLVASSGDPYDTEDVGQIKDFKIITKIEEAFECDFNNLDEMRRCLDGTLVKKVRLDYKVLGSTLDGFVVWFELSLDENNVLKSAASDKSCWDQTLFKLNHRFANNERLKYLNVTVSCQDGILSLNHYYNFPGKVFSVSPDVIKFINDTMYLSRLEYDFFADVQSRNGDAYVNVLDFSPFPYVGISLLKEQRARKLYCSHESKDFLSFVASCNCLPFDDIIFISDPVDVLSISEMFDLIILAPIDTLGGVNSSQISNYHILKEHKLIPNGRIVPDKIELWAELVHSEWLTKVGSVTNPELKDLGITELMNQFKTTNHMNLLSFEQIKVLHPFKVAELRLDDGLREKLLILKKKKVYEPVTGILYYYKLFVTSTSDSISTRRPGSYIRQACFVITDKEAEIAERLGNDGDEPMLESTQSKTFVVHFVQNQGVIKCSLR